MKKISIQVHLTSFSVRASVKMSTSICKFTEESWNTEKKQFLKSCWELCRAELKGRGIKRVFRPRGLITANNFMEKWTATKKEYHFFDDFWKLIMFLCYLVDRMFNNALWKIALMVNYQHEKLQCVKLSTFFKLMLQIDGFWIRTIGDLGKDINLPKKKKVRISKSAYESCAYSAYLSSLYYTFHYYIISYVF